MKTNSFLSQIDEKKVVSAIAEAESKTSGEIRVFISDKIVDDPVLAAEKQFLQLGMEKTKARNGVLIFFAPLSQNFAVVGDLGIHQKCGQGFWKVIAEIMVELLKKDCFTDAVVEAVHRVGKALIEYFPRESDDRDELSNEIARD